MLRKIVAFILVLVCIWGMVSIPCSESVGEKETVPTVKETDTQLSSELEVDGSIIKCVYYKPEADYALFLDDQRYNLEITQENGYTFVYFENSVEPSFEDEVVAQYAIALTVGYWGPAIVAAAKTVIAYTVKITAVAVGTYISAEAISTTISSVKYNQLTKSNVKTATGKRALTLIKTTPKRNLNFYYSAYLYKNMVMIGGQISEYAAVSRLKRGEDVFASNVIAATKVTAKASVNGRIKMDRAHSGSGDRFPHCHPYGRRWVKNRSHMPHCWYPF